MKTQYKIGRNKANDIIIRDKNCFDFHAEINYENGQWILTNHGKERPIFVNGKLVEKIVPLNKHDSIKIGRAVIHWSNHLYEGDEQELAIADIFSLHGRISRPNFIALSLLLIGLAICVFFLPALLTLFFEYLNDKIFRQPAFDLITTIQKINPFVHTIGFILIGMMVIILAIKRIRDTGNQIWKILIPIYNLKLLYFEPSKK